MRIDQRKLELAMARRCVSMKELIGKTGLKRETIIEYKPRKRGQRPETIGIIAKALGVDVLDLLQDEE